MFTRSIVSTLSSIFLHVFLFGILFVLAYNTKVALLETAPQVKHNALEFTPITLQELQKTFVQTKNDLAKEVVVLLQPQINPPLKLPEEEKIPQQQKLTLKTMQLKDVKSSMQELLPSETPQKEAGQVDSDKPKIEPKNPEITSEEGNPSDKGTSKEKINISPYYQRFTKALEKNWSRPPNVKNGEKISVLLRIHLAKSGKVEKITVVEPSVKATFDRSAVAAIQKIGIFAIPQDEEIYAKHFRTIEIIFVNPD